jgi:fatty-acyl-CoA synthase
MLAVVGSPGATAETVCAEIEAAIQSGVEAGQFPKWAMPERIELLEALPKTSVGKMDKKRLRAKYGDCG